MYLFQIKQFYLMKNNLIKYIVTLCISISISLILLATRIYFSDRVTYFFLIWNLILASIPFVISMFMFLYKNKIKSNFTFCMLLFSWLIFFPNAPYIITDLVHFKQREIIPLWFDIVLILSFIWNGMILGYTSLVFIQEVISEKFNNIIGWIVTIFSIVLSSFGIYLGRYLRWNSWDIISNPFALFTDVLYRFFNPFDHPKTYGVTFLFSIFLISGYLMIRQLMKVNFKQSSNKL